MSRKPKRPNPAKAKAKLGRPRKQISEASVLELARIGSPQEEIARILQCSVDTLTRHFADTIKRGKAELCGGLRKLQVKMAIQNENTTMAIWLGKQILGQKNEPAPQASDHLAELVRQIRIKNECNLALYGPDDGDVGDGDEGDS